MEYHAFIDFFAALSRVAGFNFLKAKTWNLPPIAFQTYCYFTDCLLGFYVFRIFSRVFLPLTLPQAIEWISTLIYVGIIFLKTVMLKANHSRLAVCVEKMDNFFRMVNKRDPTGFREVWSKQYNTANILAKLFVYSQVVVMCLAYGPSFYNTFADPSAKFMTFPSYYFFYDVHYGFKVGYLVLDFVTSNYVSLKTSTTEMLYLTFVSYYIASLTYMKDELRKIFQDFSVGKLNKSELQWWIETHKETLREIVLFRELVRNLLLVIYIYNLFNIITMTLFLTANGDMAGSQKLVAIVVVPVTVFYFFWDCILTDELEHLHGSLMFEAYTSATAFGPKTVKHCVLMSTLRSRLPIKITAGGFFTPTCWNFKELLTTTVSFLITLREVKNRADRQMEMQL